MKKELSCILDYIVQYKHSPGVWCQYGRSHFNEPSAKRALDEAMTMELIGNKKFKWRIICKQTKTYILT